MKNITFSIMQTRIQRKHFMLNIASKGWFSLVMESEKSGYFLFPLLLHLRSHFEIVFLMKIIYGSQF